MRAQLAALKQFMESFDFIHMCPNQKLRRVRPHSPSEQHYTLEHPRRAYAVYFRCADQPRRTKFSMGLPKGRRQAEWLFPRDGSVQKPASFAHPGGGWLAETPDFWEDIALRLKSVAE